MQSITRNNVSHYTDAHSDKSSSQPEIPLTAIKQEPDQAKTDPINERDLNQIAYDWTCLSPVSLQSPHVILNLGNANSQIQAPFKGYLLLLIGGALAFYALVATLVWCPQWNEQKLVTKSQIRRNENQYPTVVIATAIGDSSHGTFGAFKGCAMKNQRNGNDSSECDVALSTRDHVEGANLILYSASASPANRASRVGEYLEIQASRIWARK
jgi:hypothetical protein